ncbi:MAG: hypothetical protein ACFB15_00970 [Cyclobacteriaceae bacterium]
MERKLDQQGIKQYSEQFTKRVLSSAYEHTQRLNGQAILNLTPVRQVNLFTIKGLFDQWQVEINKLRSPYFDYEAEEVQEALDNFINTLSQYISVDHSHLQPLVKAAVTDTLQLVFAPVSYAYQQLEKFPVDTIRTEDLMVWLKYVKVNRPLLESFAERFRQYSGEADRSDAIRLLDETVRKYSGTFEDTNEYVSTFSEVYPLDSNQLFLSAPVSAPMPDSEEPLVETETVEEEPVDSTDSGPRTLHDYLSEQSLQSTTLADIQRKNKISSIREHIGVNQRYMFIRELFGNNPQEYQQAISELDKRDSYVEAFNFLRHEFAQKYRWKMDSEEVVELLEIVSKRYN